MFEPNHDPGVADGDDGEGNDVLHDVPGDVVIILLKERETFVFALDVPIIVLYEIIKYWIIQLNNDCKEVQAQDNESCFVPRFSKSTEGVEHSLVSIHRDGCECEAGHVHGHI